jgi:hypothetical protein
MGFGITSGNTSRTGPKRFNKTLRRQILKRKQRIGKITAGASPVLPSESDVLGEWLEQKNLKDTQVNRLIAASILGQGSTTSKLIQFVKLELSKAAGRVTAQSRLYVEFIKNLAKGG